MLREPFDDQLFGGAVGFGDQIEFAFHLEGDAALEVIAEQRAGFVRDLRGGFQITMPCRLQRDLVQVLDVVLEDEQIRRAGAGDADKALVVVLDHAIHLFVVAQLDAHRNFFIDEMLEIVDLFERLFGRTRAFRFGFRHETI